MTTISASLSSSAYFTPSIFSFQNSSNELAISTSRLASGYRVNRASDDVASFSIATRLQSQISGLKQASLNIAQGSSLLQVAEGGLGQISELLDLLKSTAVQANSGSITAVDRSYLQQQFSGYLQEIDRIANNTSFNDIALLNGVLSGEAKALTQITAATKASATLAFSANPTAAQTLVLNGVSLVAGTDFAVGGSTQITIDNIVTAINNSTNGALSQVTASRSGTNGLVLTAKSGGKQGNQFIVNQATSTTSFTTAGASTNVANVFTLSGGLDNGLNINSTLSTGTIGDALVTTQAQAVALVTLTLTGAVSDGETLRLDDGNGGFRDFTFRTTAASSTEIQIGATTEETLQNIVSKLSQYNATDNYGIRQLSYTINGSSLEIRGARPGNPTDLSGAALDIAETLTNGVLSAASFSNGTNTGVNTSGVNNPDFIGTIQGISATYVSPDNITLSLTVGGSIYTAALSDTTPAGATTLRFSSTSGGFFDVQIAAGGLAVANQSDANTFASRLNTAFSTLSFSNDRPVSSFLATGSFIGGSARLQLNGFSDVRIDSINVTAPSSVDGTIDITINGETYRAIAGLGGKIGAFETVKFTNVADSSKFLTLNNGSTVQDFSSATTAATFQSALRGAFGLGLSGSGVNFQIGAAGTDVVNVVVNDSRIDRLFNGVTPGVSTQAGAAAAQTAIAIAKTSVLTNISRVGALLQRFNFAQDNVTTTTEGITQARSNLIDTDFAAESTAFARATLKVNSAIAVIAQTRNLQSNLLGLLQFGGGRG